MSPDERYAALEDSSLDDDSIRTSNEETDGAKSDEETDKDSDSSTDKEWEGGTEPSSKEIKLMMTSMTRMKSSRWLLRCL